MLPIVQQYLVYDSSMSWPFKPASMLQICKFRRAASIARLRSQQDPVECVHVRKMVATEESPFVHVQEGGMADPLDITFDEFVLVDAPRLQNAIQQVARRYKMLVQVGFLC